MQYLTGDYHLKKITLNKARELTLNYAKECIEDDTLRTLDEDCDDDCETVYTISFLHAHNVTSYSSDSARSLILSHLQKNIPSYF
jgi:hypothetical protein